MRLRTKSSGESAAHTDGLSHALVAFGECAGFLDFLWEERWLESRQVRLSDRLSLRIHEHFRRAPSLVIDNQHGCRPPRRGVRPFRLCDPKVSREYPVSL